MPAAPILITAAVTAEVQPLVRRFGLKRRPGDESGVIAWQGTIQSQEVRVVLTGIGHRRAEHIVEAIISDTRFSRVIIAGFAGGADPAFRVADVVIPRAIVDLASHRQLSPTVCGSCSGVLATCAHLVSTPWEKSEIFESHKACAVDMESAAIAGLCDRRGIAWLCVRAISDTAQTALPPYLLKFSHADGRPALGRAALHALSHPWHIGAMLRLGGDCRRAAEALAGKIPLLLV